MTQPVVAVSLNGAAWELEDTPSAVTTESSASHGIMPIPGVFQSVAIVGMGYVGLPTALGLSASRRRSIVTSRLTSTRWSQPAVEHARDGPDDAAADDRRGSEEGLVVMHAGLTAIGPSRWRDGAFRFCLGPPRGLLV